LTRKKLLYPRNLIHGAAYGRELAFANVGLKT
jgi:hypothetical protein